MRDLWHALSFPHAPSQEHSLGGRRGREPHVPRPLPGGAGVRRGDHHPRRRRPRLAPAPVVRRGPARRAHARPPGARSLPGHPHHRPRHAGGDGHQERGDRDPQGRHRLRYLRLPDQAGQPAADPLGRHPAARRRPDPPAAPFPRLRDPVPGPGGPARRPAGLARVGRAGGRAGRVGSSAGPGRRAGAAGCAPDVAGKPPAGLRPLPPAQLRQLAPRRGERPAAALGGHRRRVPPAGARPAREGAAGGGGLPPPRSVGDDPPAHRLPVRHRDRATTSRSCRRPPRSRGTPSSAGSSRRRSRRAIPAGGPTTRSRASTPTRPSCSPSSSRS